MGRERLFECARGAYADIDGGTVDTGAREN